MLPEMKCHRAKIATATEVLQVPPGEPGKGNALNSIIVAATPHILAVL